MAEQVEVVHYTDPSCPWAYSAEPFMRALEWRYGDGLAWRLVTIGLREDTSGLVRAGTTPESRVNGWRWFSETFGMPLLTTPRARLVASGPMCRAVKAAGLQGEAAQRGMLRGVRMAWFTSLHLLDEADAFAEVAQVCRGRNDPPDIQGTQAQLARLAESGGIRRTSIGDDQDLWLPAG